MPPKKPKGKKGKKGKKEENPDSAFDDFLNEMYFLSAPERDRLRQRNAARVKAVFQIFQGELAGFCDVREVGNVFRYLGLNVSLQQLKKIVPLVQDDSGNNALFAKLEPMLLDVMETHELKYTTPGADGPVVSSMLIARDPEGVVQKAFDVIWDQAGRKQDQHDHTKYIDSEVIREKMVQQGDPEAFDDNEITEFLNAAADPETGFIKEDLFTLLCLD